MADEKPKFDPVVATGVALVPHPSGMMLVFNRPTYTIESQDAETGSFTADTVMSGAMLVTPQLLANLHALIGSWHDQIKAADDAPAAQH